MDSPERFKDSGETKYDFADRFIVECPRCSRRSFVSIPGDSGAPRGSGSLFLARRFTCTHCGLAKNWNNNVLYTGNEQDWYFLLPLWLQTSCCGERLYFYNEKHMDFIERYVRAEHREQMPNVNKSIISRLPPWMKDPKNREKILKAIATMKARS
jgi:transposase-like protein